MELPTDQATIMDYAQSVSLPSSGSSTQQVSHCDWLQPCNADIRKYTITHTGVTPTLNSLVPFIEETPEMQELIQRQTYLKERLDAVVSEFYTLSRCNTSACPIHGTPFNSPTKVNSSEFLSYLKLTPLKGRKA
ncbi:hypothetical protein TNIN_426171 [Trichonephila inaurata madagascariensis]|uniref:Uncharacterized protein n=1 Tax=Trichonephila inaurata madagascariensis TaxID=2747483 RepID=A0A8X6I2T9_9ARAC|nr:hypothetical protein TNIN_426171 [Trichonephila inaurata madagascariensis]